MDIPLTELRAQRDLVKRQLDWLDRRLAEAGAGETETPPPIAPVESAATHTTDEPPESLPKPAAEVVADTLIATYSEESRGLSSNAKAGCVAAAIVIAGIFLFILFGLPYLLYSKNGDTTGSPNPTERMP